MSKRLIDKVTAWAAGGIPIARDAGRRLAGVPVFVAWLGQQILEALR